MFMALVTSLVVLFYCCGTADILTKLLQQCLLIFIVVPWLYLGNSQVSVYRTIGPTLVFLFVVTAAGVVLCGIPKKRPRTLSIVQFIFYFWSFEISRNILRNQKTLSV